MHRDRRLCLNKCFSLCRPWRLLLLLLLPQVAAPLLRTLAAMHAVGVTHRDVKLENIFMDAGGAVKLGDFDLAVFHHEAQARAPVG